RLARANDAWRDGAVPGRGPPGTSTSQQSARGLDDASGRHRILGGRHSRSPHSHLVAVHCRTLRAVVVAKADRVARDGAVAGPRPRYGARGRTFRPETAGARANRVDGG